MMAVSPDWLSKKEATIFGDLYQSGNVIGVNDLFEDSDRRLWICGDNGLGYYDENYNFFSVAGSLINNSLVKIREDYEGSLWIASSREGLLHLAKSKFMDVNFAASLPRSVVNATQPFNGVLYIGTDEGLLAVDRDHHPVENHITEKFEGVRVRHLMTDSQNRLWVGTFNARGIACISPAGEIEFFSRENGLTNDNVRMSLELYNGDIAVATNDGVGIIRDGEIIRTYTQKDGLSNSTILNMCEDDEGTLYLGSDGGGIFSVRDNVFKNYGKNEGLRSGVILRMLYDPDNDGIWVSTSTNIDLFRNSGFHPVSVPVDVIGSGIYEIKRTPDGKMMLLTSLGIFLAGSEDLLEGGAPSFTAYSRKEGLLSSVTANSWSYMDESGQLYLCCVNGVYEINVMDVFINRQNPKIAIRKAEVDGVIFENPTELTLQSNVRRLTLDLAVLSYVNPGYNKVEYSLAGFENDKIEKYIKDLDPITYTNLSGGDYTFEFNATNSDGVPAEKPISLPITKEKRFLERPIAIIAMILSAAALIVLVTGSYYRRKNTQLEKRQKELRAIITQAITAIANTIDAKDPYTRGHSKRVADYCVLIAKKLGLDDNETDNLYYTALLHDIGKIGISDAILKKEGKLTGEEYEVIKQHSAIGGDILKDITVIEEIKEGAAFHHERFDGTGYNTGLKGDQIPLFARIICVADALDAMGTSRPYRQQRSLEYIISELRNNSGTQFDPQIAQISIDLIIQGEVILQKDEGNGS